jgi:two-component system, cell cycle response regulator DivK
MMKTTHELMDLVHSETRAIGIPPIVLIVDGDDDTLELYDALFSHHGYWVARAKSGLQALECAQDLQPNAIVTDLGLSGDMDGTDLIRELRADEKLCKVPVLLLTGRMPRDLRSFAGLPVSGLLLKPITPETLMTKVETMLRASGSLTVDAAETPVTLVDQPIRSERDCTPSSGDTPPCKSTTGETKVDKKRRLCPQCGTRLTWVETRRWRAGTYDYYRECTSGCGLLCFNRASRAFELLVAAADNPRDELGSSRASPPIEPQEANK